MNNISLKYPILLVHGLAAVDNAFFWGRIPEKLEQEGIKVYHGDAEAWGTIETNAEELAKKVDEILKKEKCDKVNIIAHSKGGLDSRYLISSLGYGPKIASLTTLSTPHRGSKIADYILSNEIFFQPFIKDFVKIMVKLYGDKSPEPYGILRELSTESLKEFNDRNPDYPGIYYNSYFSVMKNWSDNVTFFPSYKYLKRNYGINDGVVCIESAKWGSDFTLIEGLDEDNGICHTDMIDVKRHKISGVDIPDIYLEIVKKLASKNL